MATYVLRLWLPDRPGALGAVASSVGTAGGDVVAIDILERGAGRAVDELVVELPDDTSVSALVARVVVVDGVDVEEVRPAPGGARDARLDALETAALLVAEQRIGSLLVALVEHAHHDFDADWAAVVDLGAPAPLATAGRAPHAAWLGAFVAGSRTSTAVATGDFGPDDVAWAHLAAGDLALVLGRHGRPFRARERRQAAALARIADQRWLELASRPARLAHPSAS